MQNITSVQIFSSVLSIFWKSGIGKMGLYPDLFMVKDLFFFAEIFSHQSKKIIIIYF